MNVSNAGAMGILAVIADSISRTFSNPTNSYGTEVEVASSRAQVSYIREWASAGSTGTSSVTLDALDDWMAHQFALKPAAGGASWAANQDTKLTGLAKNTVKRIRFEVSNEGTAGSGAVTYQLQVAETDTCGSGSYSAVPTDTSGDWQIAASSYITDGENTDNVDPGLTDEATTFVDGELKDSGNTTGSITLAADEFSEIEFAVKATSNATDGGDYCFRLTATSGTNISTYTVYAEVSLIANAPDLTQIHYRWRNDDGGESDATGWWNASWGKRQAITIDNTGNSSTLTNYQVQVTVTYDSNMQADFDDIRFTNSSGTELDYWMESKTDSTSATFWVEVDSIAASSNTTIYMYYDNDAVSTTSNAKNTMFIYEDMTSTPDGTLKGNAVYDATNDWVRLTPSSGGTGQLEYSSSPTGGFVAQWKHWTGGGSSPGADAVWLYEEASSTPAYEDSSTNGYMFAADEWSDQLQVLYNSTTPLSTWGTSTIDNSTWHDVEIVFYESGGTYYYQFWYDGTQRISSSSTNTPSGSLFGWGARTGGYTNEHRIDDLVVRKYTSPDPGVSLGSEEPLQTGATWAANQDTKLTDLARDTLKRIRFEVSNEGTVGSGAVTYQLQVAETDTCLQLRHRRRGV